MWSCLQIAVASLSAWLMLSWTSGALGGGEPLDNRTARLVLTLAAGFGGAWLFQFVVNWIRYGWRAAKSTSLTP